MDWVPLIITGIKVFFFTFVVILPLIAYSTYAERRVCAIMQDRVGPNRVGIPLTLLGFKKDLSFFGLLQPLADGLKGLFKQDLTPGHVRKSFYWMAPALTAIPAFITVCVIPFGSNVNLFGHDVKLVIADIGAGPLFVFAIASLSVYGITLAGWSSNSKYPFFGGVRSCAQMISYEISLGLSIIPVLMVFGKLNLTDIVTHQSEKGWLLLPLWNEHGSIFSGDYWAHCGPQWLLLLPLGISFIVFTTSIFAETNRMPFDLPECETELVGGYHTEYSSMKFALFFMGEYAAMIVGSAVIVTIFFGGWSLGFGLDSALLQTGEGAWKWFAGFIHPRRLPRQNNWLHHLLHLGTLDRPPPPLRPAHETRLGRILRTRPFQHLHRGPYHCGSSHRPPSDPVRRGPHPPRPRRDHVFHHQIGGKQKQGQHHLAPPLEIMAVIKLKRPKLSWYEHLYLPAIIKGLLITFKHAVISVFGKATGSKELGSSGLGVTMQYPEQKWDEHLPEYYRGIPALVTDEQGRERCVSCQLCEFICPPKAITIAPGELKSDDEWAKVEKAPKAFDIDMIRCIYCGHV